MNTPKPLPGWWPAACRKRFGLTHTRPAGMPKPAPDWCIREWGMFEQWRTWLEHGRHGPRPKIWKSVPQWAWQLWAELEAHEKPGPSPSPSPPGPAPVSPSWTLTNGPWVFVESDPESCRPGPWTRLDILENEIGAGSPVWHCPQGRVLQAEGPSQYQAALEYNDEHPVTVSQALVSTLGVDPLAAKRAGISSCFAECYLQMGEVGLRNWWQCGHDGWDPIPCVGVYDSVGLAAYLPADDGMGWPGLGAFGRRFGVYASDAMGDEDWRALGKLVG